MYIAVHLSGNIIRDDIKKEIRDIIKPSKRIKDIYEEMDHPDDDADEGETHYKKFNSALSEALKFKLEKFIEK
jgi:hypothetical protein